MKDKIQFLALGLVAVFLMIAYAFEWQDKTSTWGLWLGLMLLAGSVLFIANSYNNKD